MRIVTFGATGKTGRRVVEVALERDHDVVAVARNPERIATTHQRLAVHRGDVLEPGSLLPALEGADAVMSALGPDNGRAPTTVYSTGIANVLAAMEAAHVRRIVAITAVPAGPQSEAPFFERRVILPLLDRLFAGAYADMRRMEELLRNSDFDWTVVRPPKLEDKPAKGHYRSAINGYADGRLALQRITCGDLAAAVLDSLDDPKTIGAAVGVAN